MTVITVPILLLLIVVNVCGNHASEIDNDELPGVFGYPGRDRRTHVNLPLFSKNDKGKGKGGNMYYGYYERKSDKAYKSSKQDKKDGKKYNK
jgi:hypothetical protein